MKSVARKRVDVVAIESMPSPTVPSDAVPSLGRKQYFKVLVVKASCSTDSASSGLHVQQHSSFKLVFDPLVVDLEEIVITDEELEEGMEQWRQWRVLK